MKKKIYLKSVFKKAKIDFNFLDALKNSNEIYERNTQDESLNNRKLKNTYKIEIDNIKTEISYSQNIKPEKDLENVLEGIIITPETKISFDWFFRAISDLENVLSLISDIHVQRTQMLFYINDNEYISFLHQLSYPVDKKEINKVRLRSQVIEVKHVKDKLGNILQSWF